MPEKTLKFVNRIANLRFNAVLLLSRRWRRILCVQKMHSDAAQNSWVAHTFLFLRFSYVLCNNCNRHLVHEHRTFCPPSPPLRHRHILFLFRFSSSPQTRINQLRRKKQRFARSGSITEKKNFCSSFSLRVFAVENLFARCNFTKHQTGRVNRRNASDVL